MIWLKWEKVPLISGANIKLFINIIKGMGSLLGKIVSL